MSKVTHKPLAPLKPGDKVKWRDSDGDYLKRGSIYTVTATSGHYFNLDKMSIKWGWDESQFEKVDK